MSRVEELLAELKELGVPPRKLTPIRFWERTRKKQAEEIERVAYEAIVRDEAFIVAARYDEKATRLVSVEVLFRMANPLCDVPNLEVAFSPRGQAMQDKWVPLVEQAFRSTEKHG